MKLQIYPGLQITLDRINKTKFFRNYYYYQYVDMIQTWSIPPILWVISLLQYQSKYIFQITQPSCTHMISVVYTHPFQRYNNLEYACKTPSLLLSVNNVVKTIDLQMCLHTSDGLRGVVSCCKYLRLGRLLKVQTSQSINIWALTYLMATNKWSNIETDVT